MNKHVEVKISKSGQPVPVVEKVHLHSIYSPLKEAESFTLSNEKKIASSSRVLIFGLGFGYHVESIEKRMQHHYGQDYEIVVIEPNMQTHEQWRSLRPSQFSSHVRIVSLDDVSLYFKDRLLTDFLVQRPAIISHTSSFQLYEDFFKSFLSYSYAKGTQDSADFVKNEGLHSYLNANQSVSTEELISGVQKKNSLEKWDYFTLALNEITKQK